MNVEPLTVDKMFALTTTTDDVRSRMHDIISTGAYGPAVMLFALPVGCPASRPLAAWPHEHCPLVWSDPTGPSQDTILQEKKKVSGLI